MKTYFKILAIILAIFASDFGILGKTLLLRADTVEKVYLLDESINLAILNNQQLLTAQLDTKIAQHRLKEAKSSMYPQLELNTNISRFEAESPLLLAPILGSTILPSTKDPNENNAEVYNYYTAKISLFQILWNAGKLNAMKKYASTELKTAESNYETIKNNTIAEIKKAFYKVLAGQKKLENYYEISSRIPQNMPAGLSAGEMLKIKRKKREFEYLEQDLKNELELARINFLKIAGIELDTTFTVKGELLSEHIELDLNKCLAWAMQYRPELKKIVLQEELDALEVSLSLSGRYPTIAVGGNYQLEDTQLPFDKKSWNATINITIPIFDGFAQYSRIRQKKYQYRKATISKANIIDSIKAETRKAFVEYSHALKIVNERTKDYEEIKDIFGTKKETNYNSLKSMEELEIYLVTHIEYINAIEQAIVARVNIENAIGKNIE